LELFRRIGARHRIAWCCELATALDADADPLRAARLWGAAAALREQIGAPMWPIDRPEYERRVAACHTALGDEAFEAAWQAGRALSWEQAADAALALLA
jgi:hypothetical protein